MLRAAVRCPAVTARADRDVAEHRGEHDQPRIA